MYKIEVAFIYLYMLQNIGAILSIFVYYKLKICKFPYLTKLWLLGWISANLEIKKP